MSITQSGGREDEGQVLAGEFLIMIVGSGRL